MPTVRDQQLWTDGAVIFAGGMIGTALRSLLSYAFGFWIFGLAIANLVGCLMLGLISGYYARRVTKLRLFLATGLVASFTSWSALALQGSQSWLMVCWVLGQGVVGVGLAGAGHLLGRRVRQAK